MQDVQRMQANAQGAGAARHDLQFHRPDVSFNRIMQGALGHVDQFQQVAEQQQTAVDMGKAMTCRCDDRQPAGVALSPRWCRCATKSPPGFNDLMSMSI